MKKAVTSFSTLTILLIAVNLSFGQADIGFNGIGGKIGFIDPESNIESTIGLGVVADLGTITPDIHLGVFIDYWGKSYDFIGSKMSFSEFAIGAAAKYYFKMENSKFKPYAGGGLAITIGKSKYDSPQYNVGGGSSSYSSSDTEFGFRVLGGADMELSPGLLGFGEIVYHTNGVDYLGIFVGVVKMLGE